SIMFQMRCALICLIVVAACCASTIFSEEEENELNNLHTSPRHKFKACGSVLVERVQEALSLPCPSGHYEASFPNITSCCSNYCNIEDLRKIICKTEARGKRRRSLRQSNIDRY
ncbi:hypothetical protein PFISCL1PPCAC_3305, partial [Pristionchus fissidentatus]